ncbi:MAG: hypothetical protein AB8B63_11035 [Granulosicoccus sp.]
MNKSRCDSTTELPAIQESVTRRSPDIVMRLERLGSFHQTRLSFMRILTRRLQKEQWQFQRREFEVDAEGVGYAVYSMGGPLRQYSLIAFSHDLPDAKRSDRVIAEAWDATFTLFDGIPTKTDIERLAKQVPLQEAGRLSEKELTLSRANRSVRLWTHVVDSLASGKQPDPEQLKRVGYLMRTTAVYGSGKFGVVDRQAIDSREEFAEPFQVEMLSVYLIRAFVRDLVQHMANIQARKLGDEQAAELDSGLARCLGIGNSTGLGMAPFLINHPRLFNNWIMVREEALARVLSLQSSSAESRELFLHLLEATQESLLHWKTEHTVQQKRNSDLCKNLMSLRDHFLAMNHNTTQPWLQLYRWAMQALGVEAQECLVSLLLEPYPHHVDGLACCLSDSLEQSTVDASMSVAKLGAMIELHYSWALAIDWSESCNTARAWYVSEEKLEPRLGERAEEPLDAYEQPLAPGRDVASLFALLKNFKDESSLAPLLLQFPHCRQAVERVQLLRSCPYAEIRDNTISADLIPYDMLRCKLSFFGATHFDPRSDRWIRICLYANAPYPEELLTRDADRWVYAQSG